jgi:hypothetical protein
MSETTGAGFTFNKPNPLNTGDENQNGVNTTPPVEEEVVTTPITTAAVQKDIDMNEAYVDRRSVTIALVKNYSKYREANRTALPERIDYIGSSVNSSRMLSANKQEVETYFPNIVGLSPNHPDFTNRVKSYLNNIQIKVDGLGKSFDISFRYNHYKDYLNIVDKEERIETRYKAANRQNLKELKDALKTKINDINELEISKCSLGAPVNVEDYLMYRHCLLYNDIAKDTAVISSDPSIRFYFKDDKKEAEKLKKHRQEINKAKANYVAALADRSLFDALYIQYCANAGRPIVSSILKNGIEKEIELDKFATDEPIKFNRMFSNKDAKLISSIEHLIARGELIRSSYNQNISDASGAFIGANMGEAIAWFKNPDNNSVVESYYAKLKNI